MKDKKRISTDGEPIAWKSPFAALKDVVLPPAQPREQSNQPGTPEPTPAKHRGRVDIIRQTAHRGGKTVTVITGFDGISQVEKEQLAKEMQKACGVGGTVKEEVYENRRVLIGGQWEDAPGPHYGTVMMASISQGQLCQFTPDIVMQPDDVEAPLDGAALFVVVANEPPQGGEAFYQWRHEGVDMPGEDNAILEIDPVTEADAGMYTCVIRNGCGSVTSHAAQLTVRLPPTFQWQPVSVTTCAGATAAFMATMSGTTPITYEWMQNNAPLDPMPPRFSVVTSPDGRVSTLMIADVTLADEADYTVRVTNVAGTDVSETAELVVQAEYIPGDVNRDEHVNAQDVSPFVDALLGPAPIGLSFCAADMNHSGAVDGDDVALFVEALIAP